MGVGEKVRLIVPEMENVVRKELNWVSEETVRGKGGKGNGEEMKMGSGRGREVPRRHVYGENV